MVFCSSGFDICTTAAMPVLWIRELSLDVATGANLEERTYVARGMEGRSLSIPLCFVKCRRIAAACDT